jgi:hypothetical protein
MSNLVPAVDFRYAGLLRSRTRGPDTVLQNPETPDLLGIRRARANDAEVFACWCMNADSSPFRPGRLTLEEQASMRDYPGFEQLGEILSHRALALSITILTSTQRRRLSVTKWGFLGVGRADTRVGTRLFF